MADYVPQDLNLRLAGQPWTSAKASADAENLDATAEGSTDAPVIRAGWHPVDAVARGDGNTGVVWDFATDGAVANVTYNTEAGYDYRVEFEQLKGSSGVTIRGLMSENATYETFVSATFSATGNVKHGMVEVLSPKVTRETHVADGWYVENGQAFGRWGGFIYNGNATAIDALRVVLDGLETEGAIRVYRRLSYR